MKRKCRNCGVETTEYVRKHEGGLQYRYFCKNGCSRRKFVDSVDIVDNFYRGLYEASNF